MMQGTVDRAKGVSMGEKVIATRADLSDRQHYRRKLQSCQEALERMLHEQRFDRPRAMMGLEIELNLADEQGLPLMRNEKVLAAIGSPDFQTELGQFNIEVNVAPHQLSGHVFEELREELDTGLRYADRRAAEAGARIIMVGVLPTLETVHTGRDSMSHNNRYSLLSDQIMAARGEDIALDIEGVEHLQLESVSMVAEAAATSLQLHLQVTPDRFAPVWNAAQAIAAVQVALGANAPFLFGRELWRETRPVLFQQACDTRSAELKAQGCARSPGSGSAGWTRRRSCSPRTCATSRPCCRSATTRTRPRCSPPAACRGSARCGCTTGPSTAGTGRSTT